MHDGRVARFARRVVDEALVDFEVVQRPRGQVGEAGITGAEIVDGKADAQVRQVAHARQRGVALVDQQAFRQLQDQGGGRRAVFGQRRLHAGGEIGLAELGRTDIHGQGDGVARLGLCQQAGGAARFAQGPVPEPDDEPRFLGDGDEYVGCDKAAVRLRPAHQQFGPRHPAVAVDLRLHVHAQLPHVEGARQRPFQGQAALQARLHGRFKEGDAVAPFRLGAVHGDVGFAQQVVRLLARFRQQGHADAGAAMIGLGADVEVARDGRADFFGHLGRRAGGVVQVIGQVRQQHDEFVAADARHRVGLAHQLRQPFARQAQQRVARGMAARVVDVLEVVEVDEHQRADRMVARRGGQQVADAVHQQAPVGQARQHVVEGQAVDVRFRFLALVDFALDSHPVRLPAIRIRERHQFRLDPVRLAGLVVVQQFRPGRLGAGHGGGDARQFVRIGGGALLEQQAAAQHLGARIAAAALEGVVDEDDACGGHRAGAGRGIEHVGDHHHVVQAGQRRRRQAQLGVELRQGLAAVFQVAQQEGAGQGQHGGDKQEVQGHDQRAQHGRVGRARQAQGDVGMQAEEKDGQRGQDQGGQGRSHAQQQCRQYGHEHHVDLADGTDFQQQAHADQVGDDQELPDAPAVGHGATMPDDADPADGQQVEGDDGPDGFARGQQRAGNGRDDAKQQHHLQQAGKDQAAPVREIARYRHAAILPLG